MSIVLLIYNISRFVFVSVFELSAILVRVVITTFYLKKKDD